MSLPWLFSLISMWSVAYAPWWVDLTQIMKLDVKFAKPAVFKWKCSAFHRLSVQSSADDDEPTYIITANSQLCVRTEVGTGEISPHKMGFDWVYTEQFPGRLSGIKSRISLDYSLWWPLRVLSSGYLKNSPATLRPAQRRLQGFGPFERFKVQAFRVLITHSAYTHGEPA